MALTDTERLDLAMKVANKLDPCVSLTYSDSYYLFLAIPCNRCEEGSVDVATNVRIPVASVDQGQESAILAKLTHMHYVETCQCDGEPGELTEEEIAAAIELYGEFGATRSDYDDPARRLTGGSLAEYWRKRFDLAFDKSLKKAQAK